MPHRRFTKSGTVSAIRQLRLDAWRPIPTPHAGSLLGSLRRVLSDFVVPAGPVPVVPTQRTVPEVADRLRWRC